MNAATRFDANVRGTDVSSIQQTSAVKMAAGWDPPMRISAVGIGHMALSAGRSLNFGSVRKVKKKGTKRYRSVSSSVEFI